MTQPAERYEVAALSDAELTERLAQLDAEEQLVSRRRRRLHDRLDNPNALGAGQSLTELRAEERAVSEQRLQLHRQINELRIERGRRIARSHLSPVE